MPLIWSQTQHRTGASSFSSAGAAAAAAAAGGLVTLAASGARLGKCSTLHTAVHAARRANAAARRARATTATGASGASGARSATIPLFVSSRSRPRGRVSAAPASAPGGRSERCGAAAATAVDGTAAALRTSASPPRCGGRALPFAASDSEPSSEPTWKKDECTAVTCAGRKVRFRRTLGRSTASGSRMPCACLWMVASKRTAPSGADEVDTASSAKASE